MLKAFDTVIVGGRAASNDKLVVCIPWVNDLPHAVPNRRASKAKQGLVGKDSKLTRDVASYGTVALVTRHFNLDQPFTHVQIDSGTHEVVAPNSGHQLSQRLNEGSGFNGTDTCGGQQWGECKVGLGRDERDVVLVGRQGLDQRDRLQEVTMSAWSSNSDRRDAAGKDWDSTYTPSTTDNDEPGLILHAVLFNLLGIQVDFENGQVLLSSTSGMEREGVDRDSIGMFVGICECIMGEDHTNDETETEAGREGQSDSKSHVWVVGCEFFGWDRE